jgi:serine/threonine protein phosphatase 1
MVSKPEIHKNRIALDTGAFHTGKLTCLVLNGKNRYFLQATQQSHAVSKIAA